MISDEARKWAEEHGVVFGEDGLPVPVIVPGPPQACLRCKGLTEYGAESVLSVRGKMFGGVVCTDCRTLCYADSRKFWDGFPDI